MLRLVLYIMMAGAMLCGGGVHATEPPVNRRDAHDPTKVIGAETCTKCHGAELAVWRQTAHFKTYKELQRHPAATEIAKKMGLRSIKRGDLCIQCHYTLQQQGAREKAIAGVSCESCHGGARDWIAIHNDYGGPTATKESETAEHRELRLKQSIEHGMHNPANLYLIARSCCSCHMVSHEQLV
ncbi:MAG: multiheme c-type cytochrome, partial [Planctomycetota bacterium]